MVEFGGWSMPLHYRHGIVAEHLATRSHAGLFDVSHMGRFTVTGSRSLPFLQHVLTNNAAALEVGQSQYTMIADAQGAAIDDAYLYRFNPEGYLLVVNAANRSKDADHLHRHAGAFDGVQLQDHSDRIAMLSLQGPRSKAILSRLTTAGRLPEPLRNALGALRLDDMDVHVARTGYTGEPLCFELFVAAEKAPRLWDMLVAAGAEPVGLGARDTLRLEAGLPLYGHELGLDPEGRPIPIFACPLARFAVSFSALKGDFIGRHALTRQFAAYGRILNRDYTLSGDLPRLINPVAVVGRGVARAGNRVYRQDRLVGYITSGTMVPYWKSVGEGINSRPGPEKAMRAIALALLDCNIVNGDDIGVDIRGNPVKAQVVPYHLRSEAPPFSRPITCYRPPTPEPPALTPWIVKTQILLKEAIDNTRWRQTQCINLIPSEQTPSALVKRCCMLDPCGRYAEHKPVKAFCESDIFYYQGTDFIAGVERRLAAELRSYLGCHRVEARPISGQMANMIVFSALVDFINRADRKSEQRRLRAILNHHIIKGGHLSAQPMGALRDYVARDPQTERPAVVNFPVLADNPYQIDVEACRPIIEQTKPELIILGKSMILHREPLAQIRSLVDELSPATLIVYDMAHVLGLVGPHFQQPFREGADLVTGSTHKTYFGTQRGVVAADFGDQDIGHDLWEAIERRSFPGATSNHHLGTLLGLLMAAYEMNAFKDVYQPQVIANAKAFAAALKDCGLDVAGDPALGFTETHQVIVTVGFANGPEIARRLEENNIIVNFQATPEEEGFTASGALRMGVQEMTRFGMKPSDFQLLAQLMRDAIVAGADVKDKIVALRGRHDKMLYCFQENDLAERIHQMDRLI
jgi:aminomethyltransferase